MSRFWIGAVAVLLIGLIAVFSATGQSQVMVKDLETECRYDRGENVLMALNDDNSVNLNGHFPVENTEADLDYSYSSSDNNIVLNIQSSNVEAPASFWNTCLASAVYSIDTPPLEDGSYSIEVRHNGERAERRVVRIG